MIVMARIMEDSDVEREQNFNYLTLTFDKRHDNDWRLIDIECILQLIVICER